MKRTLTRFLCLIGLTLVLASCSTAQEKRADISAFVLKDLEVAYFMAKASGDELAVMCWEELIRLKEAKPETNGASASPKVMGAISAYQKARNIRRTVQKGISDDVKVACAPMLMDSGLLLTRLGLAAAGRAF